MPVLFADLPELPRRDRRSLLVRWLIPGALLLVGSLTLAQAAPKRVITEGPCGVRTVIDTEKGTATTTTTFTLETETGAVRITVPGRIATAEDGRFAWTTEQLGAIEAQAGKDALPGVLLLSRDFGDGATPFPRGGDKPLKPRCGRCKAGKLCTVDGKETCCKDATDDSCLLCRSCGATQLIEAAE